MDYRERRYYLVRFSDSNLDWWNKGHDDYGIRYDSYINIIHRKIPSIKLHAPYNHFKTNTDKYCYDGASIGEDCIQLMISCRKEYINEFENEIQKIKDRNKTKSYSRHVFIKEITKEMCGQ